MVGTAEREPVRFGVLGCAEIAWRRTLPAMVGESDVELTAVASRDGGKATRFAERFGGRSVTGYQQLVERDDVDAVYLPLPVALHAEWIERSLLAGKHVLAEKPLATSRAQADRLLGMARSLGLVLMENFMFLHHAQHDRVKDILRQGAIGELRSFSSGFTIPPKPSENILYRPDLGGGALLEIGGYPIRAAVYFLGPELAVEGALLRLDRHDVVLSGSALLSTPAGLTAQLTFGVEHSYRTGYEFQGSTGHLALDRVFTPPEQHQPVVRIERQDHREELVLPADHQFANIIRAFARAARAKSTPETATAASLVHAALIDRIHEKARRVYV